MRTVTAIDALVERCRAAHYPAAVCKLASGWVVLGEPQVLPGYCVLLPDPVVPHLNSLEAESRARFLSDMTLVGDALLSLTGAERINYAIFGNLEPALHAHIFPRSVLEPEALRTLQPWALDWNGAPLYSQSLHGDFKHRLGLALARRSNVP